MRKPLQVEKKSAHLSWTLLGIEQIAFPYLGAVSSGWGGNNGLHGSNGHICI